MPLRQTPQVLCSHSLHARAKTDTSMTVQTTSMTVQTTSASRTPDPLASTSPTTKRGRLGFEERWSTVEAWTHGDLVVVEAWTRPLTRVKLRCRLRHLQKSGRLRGEGLTWRRRTRAFRTRYDGKGAPQDRILGSYVPFTCSGPSSSHLPTSSASRLPTLNAGLTKQAIAQGRYDYDQTV